MPGGNDPDNRRQLPWRSLATGELGDDLTEQQQSLFDFVGRLGRLRNERAELTKGYRVPIISEDSQMVFARRQGDAWVLVAAQTSADASIEVPRLDWMGEAESLTPLIGDAEATATAAGWRINAGASGFTVFVPQERP